MSTFKNRNFPSQVVSDVEKISYEYGLKVAKAIESEWFEENTTSNRWINNHNDFHNLSLYARGEQSSQKYKDELSINGDLSYLNLDWKPVPIIPKFVDILVNGMTQRNYDIKAYSQDPYGVVKRTEYMQSIERDMKMKDFDDFGQNTFQGTVSSTGKEVLPTSDEELKLHMQLIYKKEVEMAEEQAIEH